MAELWSLSRLADEFELDRRTVKKRLDGVRPCGQVRGNPAWTLKVSVPHIVDSLSSSADEPEELSVSDRSKLYDAELKYLKLERERSELMFTWQHEQELGLVVSAFISTLDIMPDAMERDGVLKPAQIEPFRNKLDDLREDLHSKLVSADE